MLRQPAVAGQFYPASAEELKKIIEGLVEPEAVKEDAIGLVMPHAGYTYSGSVAGATISKVRFKNTFIILAPNHTGLGKPFSIMTSGSWQTPLGKVNIDEKLAGRILKSSSHIKEDTEAHRLEHSIEVQLPFLQYFKKDVKIVPIMLSQADISVYKEIGVQIASAIRETGRGVVILASSDMSHYEPQAVAKEKDNLAINAILGLDEDELLKRVAEKGISMCGYAPVSCLIAAATELGANHAELVKYQTSGDTGGDYGLVVGYAGVILSKREISPLAGLAKKAVEEYVKEGSHYQPADLMPEMENKAGVFVCIKKAGELRGCIGTFEPDKPNVAEETITNAISSATRDPRFLPVEPEELKRLSYSVDVLTEPELVSGVAELDAKKYGVIVEAGYRRGLLLPDLEGVDTPRRQIEICRQKAGIVSNEKVNLYRFEVRRYE